MLVFGIIGKASSFLFNRINKIIKGLWTDINASKVPAVVLSVAETFTSEEKVKL